MDDINDLAAVMVGKTVREIRGGSTGDETMLLLMADGSAYGFYHEQCCCETVQINDVCGDLADLIDSPLVQAEETTSGTRRDGAPETDWADGSQTWTFYKFATIKGGVTIRWLGASNGYYSESVSMVALRVGEDVPAYLLSAAPLALASQ